MLLRPAFFFSPFLHSLLTLRGKKLRLMLKYLKCKYHPPIKQMGCKNNLKEKYIAFFLSMQKLVPEAHVQKGRRSVFFVFFFKKENWQRKTPHHVDLRLCMRLFLNLPSTYHTPLTHLVESALGMISDPCCMKPPTGNHRLFPSVYWFSSMSRRSRRHG